MVDVALAVDAVKDEYDSKIRDLLQRLRKLCLDAGLHVPDDPFSMHNDVSYQWSLMVWRKPGRLNLDMVDISVEIVEAKEYGDDPEDGINFSLMITEWGGRILGQLSPYNYTPECWVPATDPEQVAARWNILETANLNDIPTMIDISE